MNALTDASRVQALLGQPLIAQELERVDLLLQMASDQVVSAIGRTFVQVDNDTVVLQAQGGEVRLPNGPVQNVTSVIVDPLGVNLPLTTDQFQWTADQLLLSRYKFGLYPYQSVVMYPQVPDFHVWSGDVEVTYSHGYSPVPGDVQSAVASAVATILKHQRVNPDGVRSHTEALDGHQEGTEYYWRNEPETAVVINPDVLLALDQSYGFGGFSPRISS